MSETKLTEEEAIKADFDKVEAALKAAAERIKTPARIAWYMAVVIGLVCALFGFILGRVM